MRDELVCLLRALLLEVMSHHQSQAVTAEAVTAEAVTAGKEPNHEQQSHVCNTSRAQPMSTSGSRPRSRFETVMKAAGVNTRWRSTRSSSVG